MLSCFSTTVTTATAVPETAVEFGSIAAIDTKGDWVPEYGGIDFIGQVNNQPVIASSTDYTDRGGGYGGSTAT